MRRGIRSKLMRALTLTCMLALLPAAHAADEGEQAPREPPQIGAAAGKLINQAIERLNADDPAGARQAIDKLSIDALSPYERSRVEQILASIDHLQQNYAGARKHLEAALAAGGLETQEALQVRFQIAQLFLAEDNWKAGAAALEEWFALADKPNAAAYYMLAMAYYQQDDYQRAMAPAAKAVAATDTPQESWVELLLAIYLHLEKWDLAVPLIQQQIRKAPEKETGWVQLLSVYSQQQNYPRALAVMQLMHHAGLLRNAEDYLRLADQLLYAKIPHRAARLLEEAMARKTLQPSLETYEKLGNAWLAAREYDAAIEPLQRASDLARDGRIGVRIAEVHLQRKDWPAAAEAAQRAIAKGGLKSPAAAELVLGIALYNQNELDAAREAFERAARGPEQRKYARSYLQSIDARQGRL